MNYDPVLPKEIFATDDNFPYSRDMLDQQDPFRCDFVQEPPKSPAPFIDIDPSVYSPKLPCEDPLSIFSQILSQGIY